MTRTMRDHTTVRSDTPMANPKPLVLSQVDSVGIPIVVDTIPHLPLGDREAEDYLDEKNPSSVHQSEHNTLRGRCLVKDGSEYRDVEWTLKEQHTAVRKVDFFLLPIFMVCGPRTDNTVPKLMEQVGFFFMALDRGNISGVLTSTIIKDTGIKQDQINSQSERSCDSCAFADVVHSRSITCEPVNLVFKQQDLTCC